MRRSELFTNCSDRNSHWQIVDQLVDRLQMSVTLLTYAIFLPNIVTKKSIVFCVRLQKFDAMKIET